ncbi:MAG TPA: hypothetical protein P5243_10860, partial [Bacteroidales bacterium]|nr:hypothetical protein [Bacteroidales bacterium]
SGSYVIKPIPAAPAVTSESICVNEPNVALQATGSTIKWYQNANRTGYIQTSQGYTPAVTSDNTYTFHATQTVDGCESQTAPATYEVKPLPAAPIVSVTPNSICEYNTDPQFMATAVNGATVKWYKDDESTFIQNGASLTPVRPVPAQYPLTIKYFASQVVNGCEGPKNSATLQIKAKPKLPIASDKAVCEGQTTSLPAVSTQNATLNDKWYDDAAATSLLGTGYSYQVQPGEFSNADRNYYVVRVIQGCSSDTVPVKLAVIKKPTFTIGNDIEECAANAKAIVTASGFNPAINANSTITWGVNSKGLDDNVQHAVVPASKLIPINTDANSVNKVYAIYRYKDASGITCISDTVSIKYTLHKKARTPIVAFNTICQGAEIQPLQAFGSPNIVWESKNGLPTSYGQTYNFSQLGITE